MFFLPCGRWIAHSAQNKSILHACVCGHINGTPHASQTETIRLHILRQIEANLAMPCEAIGTDVLAAQRTRAKWR